MMVFTCDSTAWFIYAHILALRLSAVLLAEELYLCHAQTVLCCHYRTRLVDTGSNVLAVLAERVVLDNESILSACHKLNQSGIDTFQCPFRERFLPCEDRLPLVVEFEDIPHGIPRLE